MTVTRRAGVILAALCLAVLAVLSACARDGGERAERGEDPSGDGEKPMETTVQERSVDRMDVRELVGQMFVVSVGGAEPDYYIEKMVRERNIGGVILFGHNMESEPQVKSLTGSLQDLSIKTEPAVPMFVAVDQEGGEIGSAPWVSPQPAAAEVGRRGGPAAAREISERIGAELLRAGVNTNFAPVVDTGFGAAIGNRAYGADPGLVSEMGAASVRGFEEAGIVSAAKHFPNHGPATSDSHLELPVVEHDARTIRNHDLPPFRAAVRAGVPMVMAGHLLYPAVDAQRPASLSPEWMAVLREEVGFDGVIVTDDLAMEGATGGGPPARAAVRAVKAGADLLIVSSPAHEQADAYDAVVAAVRSGKVSEEKVRESVGRILEVKRAYDFRAGHAH